MLEILLVYTPNHPPFNLLFSAGFRQVSARFPPGFRQVSAGFRRVPPGSAGFWRVPPGFRRVPPGLAQPQAFSRFAPGSSKVSVKLTPFST